MKPTGTDLAELIARRKRDEKEQRRRKGQEAETQERLRETLAAIGGDWWADCQQRHQLQCNGKRGHLLRCRDEAALRSASGQRKTGGNEGPVGRSLI